MANLSTKIKMYAAANGVADVDFLKDVMLQDDSDGKGPYIKEWNLDIAQPSDDDLAAQESAANKEEANATVRATRKAAMVILEISWMKSIKILMLGKQESNLLKMLIQNNN